MTPDFSARAQRSAAGANTLAEELPRFEHAIAKACFCNWNRWMHAAAVWQYPARLGGSCTCRASHTHIADCQEPAVKEEEDPQHCEQKPHASQAYTDFCHAKHTERQSSGLIAERVSLEGTPARHP